MLYMLILAATLIGSKAGVFIKKHSMIFHAPAWGTYLLKKKIFFDFTLFMTDTERGRDLRQREAGSLTHETQSRDPRITPWAKGRHT